jgi:hypothetical protein
MKPLINGVSSWTYRRWLLVVLFIFGAQLGLIFWLSDVAGLSPRPAHGSIRVTLRQGPEPGSASARSADSSDPMLFALVMPEGFSGAAWLTIPRFSYNLTSSPPPTVWLNPATGQLMAHFDQFLRSNLASNSIWPAALVPALDPIRLPVPVLQKATLIRRHGDLVGRPLLSRDLPLEPEPILTNTVVRVTVDSSGRTVSAALLVRCNLPADLDALRFAKHARFAPDPKLAASAAGKQLGGLAFGDLEFRWYEATWQTLPPTPIPD